MMLVSTRASRFQVAVAFSACLLLLIVIFTAAWRTFVSTILGDFTVTFYPAAEYVLRGVNIYTAQYPNPLNGRDYPPYNPIWVVFPSIPFLAFPLDLAETLRFLIDIAAVPFLGYLTLRWARLKSVRHGVWLVLAPWHLIMIFVGHYSALIFLGILLCFSGLQRGKTGMIGVGIFLMLIKPHIVLLVLLATVLYAWRQALLVRACAIVFGMALISSIAQPSWLFDVTALWVGRLEHPRMADAVLLLPGYPWSQLSVLLAGAVFLLVYLRRSQNHRPTVWLWCVLVSTSLLGGLHSFPYDWLNLMIPLAWLLTQPRGSWVVKGTYLYVFFWLFMEYVIQVHVPPVTLIPAIVLIALWVWRVSSPEHTNVRAQEPGSP